MIVEAAREGDEIVMREPATTCAVP